MTKFFTTWEEMRNWSNKMDSDTIATTRRILKSAGVWLTLSATENVMKLVHCSDVTSYFLKMRTRFPSRFPVASENTEMELEDLHLKEPTSPRPFFSIEVGPGERTGTPAYMSHKILNDAQVIHDAVHDMESFFWIMVEFGLTHDGPSHSDLPITDDLAKLLFDYFDSGEGKKKARLFEFGTSSDYDAGLQKLENELISRFHPYFKPIGDLVRGWWKVLYMALEYRSFEMTHIHLHIIALLEKTLEDLRNTPSTPHKLTVKEERRRQRLDNGIKAAIKEQRVVLPEEEEEEEEEEEAMILG